MRLRLPRNTVMSWIQQRMRLASGLGAWLCAAAALAQTPGPPACTLVVGQGRFPAADDPAYNSNWDDINRTLATQVAAELAGAGLRTYRLLVPVNFDDVAAIVASVLDNARREGCDRVVETSLFVAAADDVIVARLRAYPVLGTPPRIGDPTHTAQQEYPNTQRNRDRLQPAALGRELAQGYLKQR